MNKIHKQQHAEQQTFDLGHTNKNDPIHTHTHGHKHADHH